ncbi:nitronate monooxygenase [Pseudomaricurvus alkylphenolicus]|nr:nitronate monooxygenase [Pseudomaricurvus alkylphenolicus]NIB40326.1 nitronate monooxygenase [Pseudomaricurvus alkylphenolicus]
MNTKLCQLTGVEYPIIQSGMGWVANGQLAAAASNAGCLGSIGAATMSYKELADAIAYVKDHTTKPFSVNLRSDSPDVFERADLMIKEGVKVAIFALAPSEKLVKKLKDEGVVCIPSIGAVRHAEKLAGWGVDAVIVQGGEAGGHTGGIATTVLLPQIVGGVDLPVIAAGGFFDGKGLIAALSYGAVGVNMGTRFLLTAESSVPANVKAEYLKKTAGDTVVTSMIDGHPHRVLRTEFIDDLVNTPAWQGMAKALLNAFRLKGTTKMTVRDMLKQALAMKRNHDYSWMQLIMAANTPILLAKTMVDGEVEHGIMSGGQCVGVIDSVPTCDELMTEIISGAEAVLRSFQG